MRITGIIILSLVALYLPFWIFVALAGVYAIIVRSPYEIVVIGLCIDSVYGNPAQGMWYAYTLATSIVFLGVTLLRPFFRFHT